MTVLDRATARNASVELRRPSHDGLPLAARARILGVEGEHLLLDRPQRGGEPVVFRPDEPLEVHFRLNDVRYSFLSRVESVTRVVRLNASKKVMGLVIDRPVEVLRAPQRRDHFRVRVVGDERVVLELHEATADGAGCPIDARRFEAELVDLSAGGTGIRVPRECAEAVTVGELVYLTFRLPDEEEPFTFLAEVRQRRPVAASGDECLGLAIHDRPLPRVMRRARERLQRCVARLQRARLRRRR